VIQNYISSEKLQTMLRLKEKCVTEADFKGNWQMVLQGLEELGIQLPLSAEDLVSGDIRDLLLLSSHLFFVLPYYKASKEPIVFECVLGETTSKIIEIENTTPKNVTYQVRYEGSQDF